MNIKYIRTIVRVHTDGLLEALADHITHSTMYSSPRRDLECLGDYRRGGREFHSQKHWVCHLYLFALLLVVCPSGR